MRALYVVLPILGILTIAYRFYSAFIAARVMCLDDRRPTPAHVRPDGQNFHVTPRWVLFGHHFAAIAGAGPLIGPVLAAQFGYAPGIDVARRRRLPRRRRPRHDHPLGLDPSWRRVRSPTSRAPRSALSRAAPPRIAILFIVIIALAGLGLAVVNALEHSAWGTFTIGMSIPLALFVGLYMYRLRPGRIVEATIIGVSAADPGRRPRQADRRLVVRALLHVLAHPARCC